MTKGRLKVTKLTLSAVTLVLVLMGLLYAQDKLKAGIEAYQKGDYDQAIYLLNQHLSQVPFDYDGNFYLGNAYFQKKDFKQAVQAYQKAYQKKSKTEVLYQLGLTNLELGDLAGAKKYAEEGTKSKGTDKEQAQIYYLLAKIQFQEKIYSDADINLRKALAVDPKNPSYHRLLGDINYERNVPSLAISEYNEALKLDSSLAQELHYRLGRAYFLNRQFNEALDQFKLAIAADSNFAEAYLDLGNLYFWGNKHSEALWAYEEYLKLRPGDPAVLLNLGKMYFASRQFDKSIEFLLKANSSKLDKDGLYRLAQAYQETKQYAEAEKRFAEYEKLVLDSEPGYKWTKADVEFWFKRGVTNFYNINDATANQMAEQCFKKVIELDSTHNEAFSYLGLLYYRHKKYGLAINNFNEKLKLDPNSYNTYANLAYAYHDSGLYDSAVSALSKSVDLKPDNLKVLGFLAWIYFDKLKNYEQSAHYYERILEFDSNDCEARGLGGVSYLIQKKLSTAINHLREAVKCNPGHEQYNLWLAQALEQAEQKESVKAYYRKVLQINPNNKVAKERLEILEFY